MTDILLDKSDKQGKQESIWQQTLHKDNGWFVCRISTLPLSLVSHE